MPSAEIRHPWFGRRPACVMPSNKRRHATAHDDAPVNTSLQGSRECGAQHETRWSGTTGNRPVRTRPAEQKTGRSVGGGYGPARGGVSTITLRKECRAHRRATTTLRIRSATVEHSRRLSFRPTPRPETPGRRRRQAGERPTAGHGDPRRAPGAPAEPFPQPDDAPGVRPLDRPAHPARRPGTAQPPPLRGATRAALLARTIRLELTCPSHRIRAGPGQRWITIANERPRDGRPRGSADALGAPTHRSLTPSCAHRRDGGHCGRRTDRRPRCARAGRAAGPGMRRR